MRSHQMVLATDVPFATGEEHEQYEQEGRIPEFFLLANGRGKLFGIAKLFRQGMEMGQGHHFAAGELGHLAGNFEVDGSFPAFEGNVDDGEIDDVGGVGVVGHGFDLVVAFGLGEMDARRDRVGLGRETVPVRALLRRRRDR